MTPFTAQEIQDQSVFRWNWDRDICDAIMSVREPFNARKSLDFMSSYTHGEMLRTLQLFTDNPKAFIEAHFKIFRDAHLPCSRGSLSHPVKESPPLPYPSGRTPPHVLDVVFSAAIHHIPTGRLLSHWPHRQSTLPVLARFLQVAASLPESERPTLTRTLHNLVGKKDLHLMRFVATHFPHDVAHTPMTSAHAMPAMDVQSPWIQSLGRSSMPDSTLIIELLARHWSQGIDWDFWFDAALPKLATMDATERTRTEKLWWQAWILSHTKAFVSQSAEALLSLPNHSEHHSNPSRIQKILQDVGVPLNHLIRHTQFRPTQRWLSDGIGCFFTELGAIQQRGVPRVSDIKSVHSQLKSLILTQVELATRDELLRHVHLATFIPHAERKRGRAL